MSRHYACGSLDHVLARRWFLKGAAAGTGAAMTGFGAFLNPTVAADMQRRQKQVLLVWLAGGVSQFESWDPKPGAKTGGPFRAIPTSVPGIHICELLPYTAQQMHRMAIIRSVNIKENDHGKGAVFMQTGRRQQPGVNNPHLGSVVARLMSPDQAALPGYIRIAPKGSGLGTKDAAFLGPRYAPLIVDGQSAVAHSQRPDWLSPEGDQRRNEFRRFVNDRFMQKRRTAETEVYSYSFDQAAQLMERRELFDVSNAPEKELERYGSHDFGRHCLLARRMLEQDVTFVQVTHTNYDTHAENFNFHLEQLGEFDRPFANLLEDLAASGRLEHTLVIVMSEFGRTPNINVRLGRDHWGSSLSVALAGCGIQHGAVVGKTNEQGTAVAEREVHAGHLFHTYLNAVGIHTDLPHEIGGRSVQLADPAAAPVKELLA